MPYLSKEIILQFLKIAAKEIGCWLTITTEKATVMKTF